MKVIDTSYSKDMNPDEKIIIIHPKEEKSPSLEMKKILINAIRMQAIYSKGKLTILETSDMIN